MESFSLLKYWRGGGGASTTRDSAATIRNATDSFSSSTTTTTIVTAVSPSSSDSEDDNGDDGPFFDLEFALPDDSDAEDQIKEERNIAAIVEDFASENDFEETSNEENQKELLADVLSDDNEIVEGDEINFTLSSSSSGDSTDPNITLSPSDDLFFKGQLVPIEASSVSLDSSESDAITKFPVSSILKSATKFRVLMLNFNKSKSNVRGKSKKPVVAAVSHPKEGEDKKQQSKFFTVKLKVEEVPLVSLFTRDNSSKGNSTASKGGKKSNNDVEISDSSSAPDDKKFSKDVMNKYLKKVKPFYIKVSKRYGEKLRFSGQLSFPKTGAGPGPGPLPPPPPPAEVKSPPVKTTDAKAGSETSEVAEVVAPANTKSQKQGNLQAGLRVVCKHLGKSRSASSTAVTVTPSAPVTSNRRDDSLLQQEDGIQSAILHCKRSFNASRDLEGFILSRSASDPSHENSASLSTEDSLPSSEDANGQRELEPKTHP